MYKDLIPVAKTRLPFRIHINFSGMPGWKQEFIKELEDKFSIEPEHRGTTKILFKAFGSVVILNSKTIRFGLLYWAIAIIKGPIYWTPEQVKADYKIITSKNNLCNRVQHGLDTGNTEMVINALDIMLKLNYSNLQVQFRVISKSGDRIVYHTTYPVNRVIVESVNGMQNQVLAAKYHLILSSQDLEFKKRNLLHKDSMTPKQRAWIEEVD